MNPYRTGAVAERLKLDGAQFGNDSVFHLPGVNPSRASSRLATSTGFPKHLAFRVMGPYATPLPPSEGRLGAWETSRCLALPDIAPFLQGIPSASICGMLVSAGWI
jgi:hypothetical protein